MTESTTKEVLYDQIKKQNKEIESLKEKLGAAVELLDWAANSYRYDDTMWPEIESFLSKIRGENDKEEG